LHCTVQPSSISCKNEVARGSKLPIPVSLPEKTSSKIKATLKNLIMSQVNDEKLASLPPEPRMTRSSSLRRANSLKRFNNRNHASVNSANANTCSTNVPTPGPTLTRSGTGGSLERCSRKPIRRAALSNATKVSNEGVDNIEANESGKISKLEIEGMTLRHSELLREVHLLRLKWEQERQQKKKLEEKLEAHNSKMREIASKMERVDQEFQRRDVTIIRLDEKLKDGQNMVQSLAKALRDAEKNILAKNQQLAELQDQLDSQKQSLDAQELREFLHVENQMLTETLADAEVDIKSLKSIVEKKDDELSQSEEQCRHLVRLSEQRHQQILYITTAMNTLEKKAKDIILEQALIIEKSMHKIKEEPFDENDIEKFCLKINRDMNELLNVYVQNNVIQESESLSTTKELSYEQSLDYLSLSIQNRLKVESAASEEKQQKLSPIKNNLFEQLSKFESVIDEITIKVEE